ncbi:hypothetical protein EDEG_03941 [Edhazardia aedis USNM 41457]|uniref:Uncharacterized protein n=1 Tax=Edhazardia aedis (strain USNM 41457) TaxID=1003232 RepID=J8ZP44_EDHAE|nr:hypothetical protein EDEG_03941 [Edhazardia aedis USNM 41457]|eukprot:EJW01478.1 hypothetical protein EDEG_03941 [Edhazardia aedis USNM 41457]
MFFRSYLHFFSLFTAIKKLRQATNPDSALMLTGVRDLLNANEQTIKEKMFSATYAKNFNEETQKISQNIHALILEEPANILGLFNVVFLKYLLSIDCGILSYSKSSHIKTLKNYCEHYLAFFEIFVSLTFFSSDLSKNSERTEDIQSFICEITEKREFVKQYFEETQKTHEIKIDL